MPFNENRESSRFYLKTIFEKFPNFNDLMVNEFYGKFVYFDVCIRHNGGHILFMRYRS